MNRELSHWDTSSRDALSHSQTRGDQSVCKLSYGSVSRGHAEES